MAKFQMLHDFGRIGRCCRHEEMVFTKPGGCAVIHDDPVFTEHQAVTGTANGQILPTINVDTLKEFCGIRALNVDLAEC